MQMLYDSESFVVVQIHANAPEESAPVPAVPVLARHGFEIVDKRSGKEVYLDGSWAELFQQRLNGWQKKHAHPGRNRRHPGRLRRAGAHAHQPALKKRPGSRARVQSAAYLQR